jgi:hypothetical protein
VAAADCPGGQFVGHPREGARQSPCDWDEQVKPVAVALGSGAGGGSGAAR